MMNRPERKAPADSRAGQSRFQQKVALITGVSDGGIGEAVARRLADEGSAIALTSRRRPERLIERLAQRHSDCRWWEMDVTVRAAVTDIVDRCAEHFGRLDVIVNNAGIEASGPLDEMPEGKWREIVDVNLRGAIEVSRAALTRLHRPGGVIVNISSALGFGGCKDWSVYSAAKAGLNGFTQSLAWELASSGIRVVGVAPALVRTPMTRRYANSLTEDWLKQIQASHPLGVGMPQDVAAAVAFLASDEARWITGVTLPLGWAPHFPITV